MGILMKGFTVHAAFTAGIYPRGAGTIMAHPSQLFCLIVEDEPLIALDLEDAIVAPG